MTTTWVLIASDAGARIFENRGPGKGLSLLQTLDHPAGRERDQAFDADRPGRSFGRDAGGTRRSAMSREQTPRDRAVSDFARKLATVLAKGRVANEYTRLVLVAPPKFLGRMRSSVDDATAACVVGSLAKDLVGRTEAEIAEPLGEVLAV